MLSYSSKGVLRTPITPIDECEGSEFTFCLSGLQAHGEEQFGPIASALPGTVIAYHAIGQQFMVRNLIRDVAQDMAKVIRCGGQVNLIGAGLGGQLVPFAIWWLRHENVDVYPERLKIVLVDAPFGCASLSSRKARMLRFAPLAEIAGGVGALLDFGVPVLGSTLPPPDHPRKLHTHQLRWIGRMGLDDALLKRALDWVVDLDVTYIHCTKGGGRIDTWYAMNRYGEALPYMKRFGIDTVHCGLEQDAHKFIRELGFIFGDQYTTT